MRDFQPPRPTGFNPEARFAQWVWDKLAKELRFSDSDTVKWKKNTTGMIATAAPGTSGGSTVDVIVCDPATGEEKTYRLRGVEVTEEEA